MAKIDAGTWYDENEARAMVDRDTFLRRISMGWKGQRALMEPLGERPVRMNRMMRDLTMGGKTAKFYEAFGLSHTLTEWEQKTGVEAHNFRHGIDKHGTLQRFLHHIGWYPGKARYVDDEDELVLDLDTTPQPWVPGQRPVKKAEPAKKFVRINLDEDLL